jgi:HSP20 family protein
MEEERVPYVLSLELPEIEEHEVQIEIREDLVTIRAMKRGAPDTGRPWRPWRRRRRFALARSFRLPPDADRERLEASFDDGTLTLRIHRNAA